jgi:hypothetical protein
VNRSERAPEFFGCASLNFMRLSEILNRLTGVSTPIAGASWQPGTPDVEVARRVLIFLEDRRVLYNPLEAEDPGHSVASVLQIRQFLTDVLANQGIGSELTGHLRGMRAACRAFLDRFDLPDDPSSSVITFEDIREDWMLNNVLGQSLGELRAVFGLHIAQIAAKYSLDVEEPLSYTIHAALPPAQDDEE